MRTAIFIMLFFLPRFMHAQEHALQASVDLLFEFLPSSFTGNGGSSRVLIDKYYFIPKYELNVAASKRIYAGLFYASGYSGTIPITGPNGADWGEMKSHIRIIGASFRAGASRYYPVSNYFVFNISHVSVDETVVGIDPESLYQSPDNNTYQGTGWAASVGYGVIARLGRAASFKLFEVKVGTVQNASFGEPEWKFALSVETGLCINLARKK